MWTTRCSTPPARTPSPVSYTHLDDVIALLARLFLGQAEGADVRRAEGRAGDIDVGDRVGLAPGDVLGGDDALVGGLVSERRTGDEVADRINAVARCAHRTVDGCLLYTSRCV